MELACLCESVTEWTLHFRKMCANTGFIYGLAILFLKNAIRFCIGDLLDECYK